MTLKPDIKTIKQKLIEKDFLICDELSKKLTSWEVGFICSTRIQYKKDDNELTHPVFKRLQDIVYNVQRR